MWPPGIHVVVQWSVVQRCSLALLPFLAGKEKLKEHLMPRGKVLTPFGVDALGRLGEAADNLLARMQSTATSTSKLGGGHACTIAERLRGKIDAHLHRHAARVCQHAEHGLPGALPRRP